MFRTLGENFGLNEKLVPPLESLVCRLYGQSSDNINKYRFQAVSESPRITAYLPPRMLRQHCKRANNQAIVLTDGLTDGRTDDAPSHQLPRTILQVSKNHPWEYYNKRTTVGSCPGLSDDPEESPRHKTLRTENFTTWSMNRDPLPKRRWML